MSGTHARRGQSHQPTAAFFCSYPQGAFAKKTGLFSRVFIKNIWQAKKAVGIFFKFKTRSSVWFQKCVFYKKGGRGRSPFFVGGGLQRFIQGSCRFFLLRGGLFFCGFYFFCIIFSHKKYCLRSWVKNFFWLGVGGLPVCRCGFCGAGHLLFLPFFYFFVAFFLAVNGHGSCRGFFCKGVGGWGGQKVMPVLWVVFLWYKTYLLVSFCRFVFYV